MLIDQAQSANQVFSGIHSITLDHQDESNWGPLHLTASAQSNLLLAHHTFFTQVKAYAICGFMQRLVFQDGIVKCEAQSGARKGGIFLIDPFTNRNIDCNEAYSNYDFSAFEGHYRRKAEFICYHHRPTTSSLQWRIVAAGLSMMFATMLVLGCAACVMRRRRISM